MTLAKGQPLVICQHFQRASSLKLPGQFHLNFIYSLLARVERRFLYFRRGHITKMAAMTIYDINLKKTFFSRTNGPITLIPGMKHLGS